MTVDDWRLADLQRKPAKILRHDSIGLDPALSTVCAKLPLDGAN